MLTETDHQTAYDLQETVRALETVLSNYGGPKYNNPDRIDLTAVNRMIRLINRTLTDKTETAKNRLKLYRNLKSRSVSDEIAISRMEAFLETVGA